jgi:hypothetical protein
MKKKWIYIVPLAIIGLLAFIALGGVIVQQLWNWLLPPLFGWRLLTFWQALGILVLCRILVGGWGGGHSHGSGIRRRVAHRVADRMAERWEHMTPEERELFRQRVRERWGFPPTGGESKGPSEGANP